MDSTEVPGIVEFLTARLDEAQRIAENAIGSTETTPGGGLMNVDTWGEQDWIEIGGSQLAHVQRWYPGFVLADIAAKRKIITLAIELDRMWDAEWGDGADPLLILWPQDRGYDGLRIVKALALPFAGHPDYQPAWSV